MNLLNISYEVKMKKSKIIFFIAFLCVTFLTIINLGGTVEAAQTSGLTNGYIYNLTNKASGKCLNVNYGTDANGTNVTQYTKDGSPEQRFKLVYNSSRDSYKLYAICSSNGGNRVVDIYRPIQSGANVDIWTPDDNDAQDLIITSRGNGYYSIHPRVDTSLALTSYGTGNGSGAGTSSTSAGNIFVSTYTGSNNQLWSFKETTVKCWYYVEENTVDRTPTHTYTQTYSTAMGYRYAEYRNLTRATFLNNLCSSEVFVYHGHGSVGSLVLDGNGGVTSTEINNLSNNALSNVKLVLCYACHGAETPNGGISVLDALNNKGAQCSVAWVNTTNINHVNEWNRLFWEKVCNDDETIVEGYRHADYWITEIYGTDAYNKMNGNRRERGNIYINL